MSDERDPLLAALEQESGQTQSATSEIDAAREKALEDFKKKLKDHRQWDAKLKELRLNIRGLEKQFDKTEDVSITRL
ncbi:proteasome regulatory particle base subunit RPT4 [Sugiyamaella lignohabitans]|uniref:Proteasome regulatory particle base subunit RPT4 n=1 Tax=Sugiyamaella lignohabitans TaxID=796027 RepID=A0A167DYH7_9ASCO|nr:proteasome regulatory particle base subunit RPT4 [Sugiyamaella lignohabitans]ANB13444.1 proteasome regulatory particle base subunit RPT4 [Sugiyamaella lignohabitans]